MTFNPKDLKDFNNTAMMILGGISASVNKFVFIAPSRCIIDSIKIVSDVATENSVADTTEYVFQVANLTQTLNLCSTAKKTSAAEIAADTAYNLGIDQNKVLSADDVLELQITKTGSPTSLATAQISIAVTYRPSDTYPAF